LRRICREHGAAIMLVTHDMGVIAETADRVAVMYAGRVVEIGPVEGVTRQPRHPYTAGLMASIPSVRRRNATLNQIDGAMPRLNAIPSGCAFNPRCQLRQDVCRTQRPVLPLAAHTAACHFPVGAPAHG
jgi:peptide/nickel transport system ATP-binding protein